MILMYTCLIIIRYFFHHFGSLSTFNKVFYACHSKMSNFIFFLKIFYLIMMEWVEKSKIISRISFLWLQNNLNLGSRKLLGIIIFIIKSIRKGKWAAWSPSTRHENTPWSWKRDSVIHLVKQTSGHRFDYELPCISS